MVTSGSTNWSINRNQIYTAMLRKLRVIDAGETAPANDITTVNESVNMMLKAWQMDGISLWLTQEFCLHLELAEDAYSLGPTGDNFCAASDAVKTQLAAAAAASATSLTVDSITGISSGDYIGIVLDDDTLHWDVVNGAPSGSTVTLTTGLASAASADNYVFAYTTKLTRPLEILELRIRDTDDNDTAIKLLPGSNEYFSITDKTSSGDAYRAHYLPHITNGTLYLWPVADDVSKRIFGTMRRVIEDLDSSTDDADAPIEALRAIVWNGAVEIAPEYGRDVPPLVLEMAAKTYGELKAHYSKRDPISLAPIRKRYR